METDQSVSNEQQSAQDLLTQKNMTAQSSLNIGHDVQQAQVIQQITPQQQLSDQAPSNLNQLGHNVNQNQSTPHGHVLQQESINTSSPPSQTIVQQQQQQPPFIKPLLENDNESQPRQNDSIINVPSVQQQEQSQAQLTPQKTVVTKVKLTDELNIFDWFRTKDIINQLAEKAKHSVDSVITTLDPGMKEYLYSGGNINIMVISDSNSYVSPIRDAFQSVFGRATVISARSTIPSSVLEYPIKVARGFDEAVQVSINRIKKLRLDTSNVPQNQVVLVLQPTIVNIPSQENMNSGLKQPEEQTLPRWFLTYSMIIEDPVLGMAMSSYSQLIPIDSDIVDLARELKLPDDFPDKQLGFSKSIDELMNSKLNLVGGDDHESLETIWLYPWAGLDGMQILHQLGLTLANSYRRKWNDCVN